MSTVLIDYIDEQLPAGLECISTCRKQNGVLNDKSQFGMIFGAILARAPVAAQEPLVELAAVQKALSF